MFRIGNESHYCVMWKRLVCKGQHKMWRQNGSTCRFRWNMWWNNTKLWLQRCMMMHHVTMLLMIIWASFAIWNWLWVCLPFYYFWIVCIAWLSLPNLVMCLWVISSMQWRCANWSFTNFIMILTTNLMALLLMNLVLLKLLITRIC